MYHFPSTQQTSTLNLPIEISSGRARSMVNKRNNIGGNIFNGDHLEMEGNPGSSKAEKCLF